MDASRRVLRAQDLYDLVRSLVVALGSPADLAEAVARGLTNANLTGHDSHGLVRMPAYAQSVREGNVHPDRRASVTRRYGATACVSAHHGWGQPAGRLAAETASRLADDHGVGAVILQDSPHVGRLADYVEQIARRGHLAMVVTNAWVNVAPFGGADRRLGTDPIAFSIPRGGEEPPIISDFATSVVAEGKLQIARADGRSVAEGTIIDPEGRPSEDPEDFYRGGSLLPAAGYKGYGLAVAIEALGGILSGQGAAMLPDYEGGNGMFVLALQVEAFVATERFVDQVRRMASELKAAPLAPGAEEILLPGELEERTRAERERDGIPVVAETWREIDELADELGVPLPAAR